jgi:superfamily II DNA or RNA helicase
LILVTNKKLMSEMIEKFSEMTNFIPSQYWDWKKDIWFITVMTKPSFLKCPSEDLVDFDTILVDENHQWFSDKFRNKMNTTFSWKEIFLYWLSWTPYTEELEIVDLEKYYGKVINVQNEYNFIPSFIFYNYKTPKNDLEFEHYSELKQCLIDDIDRYKEQHNTILNNLSDKCSLILTDRIEEANRYEKDFFEITHTYSVIKITWETKIADDQKKLAEALKKYEKDKKPIIIIWSIQKVSTGFDYGVIDTVFIYSSIKFEATVIQSVGRCLRKFEDKKSVRVVIWNDSILDKQRVQKTRAIMEEYWIHRKDIVVHTLNNLIEERWSLALTF